MIVKKYPSRAESALCFAGIERFDLGRFVWFGQPQLGGLLFGALLSIAVSTGALQRHRVGQAKWKLQIGELYQDQGLIFANEVGGLLDGQNVTGRYFKPLLRKAELLDIRLYDLRHSHATLLMAAGEHPKVVQERLGHATIQLTLDTYTHVVEGLQARASERLEALLSQHGTPARA